MKDVVIHIREDVCARYNRDPEATRLLEIAKEFGTVETLESALSAEKANHQTIIKNLTEQHEDEMRALKQELESIKEYKVTAEELEILRAVRKKSAIESSGYEKAIQLRDEQLKTVKIENENRNAQIIALLKPN